MAESRLAEGSLSGGAAPMRHSPAERVRPRFGRHRFALAAAVAAAGCAGSSNSSGSGGTPVTGGTAVMAEPPTNTPNYIFPFTSSAYISVINASYLTYLMYRPLYWFGDNGQPTVNNSLSLASPPTFSGNKVTINLKHYMWSNGQPVTAQDVMFWLNMMQALPQDWGAY